MASVKGLTLALCLLSVDLISTVTGKEPYLDFTCVASQALIPTATNSTDVSITAYSPLSNISYVLDGETRRAFHPSRVGDFKCSLETEEYEAKTTVIVSTEDASLYPPRLTVTHDPLAVDEEIILQMIMRDDCNGHPYYRWDKGGSDRMLVKSQYLSLNSAETNRSSIVCQNFFKNCSDRKGYIQLIFRECPSGKWSPEDECQLDCSICLNGGMCHPRTGQCICPPGFSGMECQNVHGRNVFGQLGQYSCSTSLDPHDDACRGQLFCLPEPFGCTCAAGYKGIDCSEECEVGTYGANCEQSCHCLDNTTCQTDSGECVGSACQEGWSGPNCQVTPLRITLEFDYVNLNQTTNITCTVRDKTPFNESDFVLVLPDGTVVGADSFVEYETPGMVEYIFNIIANSIAAVYTCSDVNMTANNTITVTAHEPPWLSSPPTVSSWTSSTVTLTWEPWNTQTGDRGEGPLVKYIITYRELVAAADTVMAGESQGNTTLFVVRGLKEATGYEFQVAAVRPGVGGAGAPSPLTIGNTTCAVPGLPTELSIRPLDATSLQLTWSPPTHTSCPTISYYITYWIRKQGKCKSQSRVDLDEITTREHSLLISNLLPDTLYKVEVTSVTEAGFSEDGIMGKNVTGESVPGPPILLSNETTSTTLQFTWMAPDCRDRNGTILGYHFQLLDADMDILHEGVTSAKRTEFESLVPCTEYLFQVRGWTSAGNGSFSDLQTATTKHGAPDRISNLQISSVNSTQLQVHWFPPVSVPCPIVGYTISYTLVQQGQCDQPQTADNVTTLTLDTRVDLVGLLPFSEYAVVVRARTRAGEGEASNATGRTHEGVPGPPTSIVVANKSSSSLGFTWDPPGCTESNGVIKHYVVRYTSSAESMADSVVSETYFLLENLLACASFSIQVGAVTDVGLGTLSETITATTESEIPDAVRLLQIYPAERTIQVMWHPPADPPCTIIGYNLTYSLIQYLACNGAEYSNEEVITTTANNATITGLSPYAQYLVSVVALTTAGAGELVEEYTETLQDVPSSPITVNNTLATPSSLSFTWQPPACSHRNGIIKGFHHQLTDTNTRTVKNGTTSANVTVVTFERLKACTWYKFKVRAQTSAGYGPLSLPFYNSTQGQAPNAVTDFQVQPFITSLSLTWMPPSNVTCVITSYFISYKLIRYLQCPEDETDSLQINVTTNLLSTNYEISGLLTAAKYAVSLRAETIGGFGDARSFEVETLESVPSSPIVVNNTLATPSSLSFTWQPPACSHRNGIIEGFHHQLTNTNTRTVKNGTTSANVTVVTFEGLKACTGYEFKVRARTSAGNGPLSLPFYRSTQGQAPNAVRDFQVQPFINSLSLTWMPPSNVTCAITSYFISYKLIRYLQCPEDETDSLQINVTRNVLPTNYEISGLLPASKYAVSLRAETIGGFGDARSYEVETLESVPGLPVSINLFEVTPRSLASEWAPPACNETNGDILYYNYKLVRTEDRKEVENRNTLPNVTSATFEQLVPCTKYHFKVRAKTSAGPGDFAGPTYVFTQGEVPEAVPDVRMVSSSHSIHVMWAFLTNQPCGISRYLITYKLIRHLQCAEEVMDSAVFNVPLETSNKAYTITGLSPASKYSVTVRAVNSHGRGEPVYREIATLESAPGLVSNISAAAIGRYSATVSWYPPPCEERHGNITRYTWDSRRLGSEETKTGSTSDTSVTISSLKPCSLYTFSVRARTSTGQDQDGVSIDIKTHVAVPGKVETPQSSWRNSTVAAITWSSPVTRNNPCRIQQYTVSYYVRKVKGCQLDVDESVIRMTNDTQISLVNLRPFSVYKVQVMASTSAGEGETSEEYKLETDADVPDQITDVRVTNASMNSLRFAWSELECGARHDRITGYRYEFKNTVDSEEDDITEQTTKLFAVIDDLDSCTEYAFRILAVGDRSDGVWSDWLAAVTTTTLPEKVENLTLYHGNNPASQIQVTWQPSTLDDCSVSTYHVAYIGHSLEACFENVSAYNWTYINVDEFSIVLRNLQPYSLYAITVRGETTAGLGKGVSANTQTDEGVPSGPPLNISTNMTGPNAVHFIWIPPACGEQNGLIVNYTYTLLNPTTNETVECGQVTAMDVLIGGLVPFVDYGFSVQANTVAGPGPPGYLVVKTGEGAPSPPRNLRVVGTNKFSLELEWNLPDLPSGIISAYQIKYWPHGLDESSAIIKEYLMNLTNPVPRYIIMELKPYTEYDIKIRGKTGAGYGDWTRTISHQTAQAAPEQPASVSVLVRTEDAITLQWEKPHVINGILTAYKIEYEIIDRPFETSNDIPSSTRSIKISQFVTSHQLKNLEGATGYQIRMAAETVELGDYFTLQPVYTRIPAIEQPTMPDKPTLSDDNVVTLQLRPINSPYISFYQVTVTKAGAIGKRDTDSSLLKSYQQSPGDYVTAEFNNTELPQTFEVGNKKTYGGYYNAPLQAGTEYDIRFCGVGETKQDTQPSCSDASSVTTNPVGGNNSGIIVILGAVIAVLVAVAFVLVIMVVVRKRRRSTMSAHDKHGVVLNNLEMAESRFNGLQNQAVVEEIVRSQLRRSGGVMGQSTTPVPQPLKATGPPKKAWKPHKPVGLQDLPEYVKRKKANGNKGFTRDYASFPDEQLYSCDTAQKEVNRNKNRYANIIPYDFSRVVLDPVDENPDTDYINASYIDGYKTRNAYIATQGHNKYSTPDFWRMVWQQEVTIIVMLTNLVENAKKKCARYWPEDQLIYDGIMVKLMSERVEHDYTERVFVITNINIGEDIPREVKQFHFTSWPDMGLPDSPAPLMNFMHEIKQIEENNTGPMVVHCSAGVGRTGTFITVDSMLNMVAEEKQINVIDFVHEMRKKRPKMVQTQEQYMFIFEVLLETLLCGDTVMNVGTFPVQYAALQDHNPLTGNSYVEEHFRVLDTMSVAPSDENCHGGRNEMNYDKNRYHDCIPLDKTRPYLMSPGEDGSTNYINASFIDAYKRKDGFLATQSPLPNTVVDFWRMVYDYNARVIVMLDQTNGADETCAPYWIDDPEDIALYGIFEVQLRDCKSFKHTVARTFKLKNTNKVSEKPRTIHHFEFKEWMEEYELPSAITLFLNFMELVEQGHRQTGGDGRIAVHCLDGVSRCGIFCAAMASLAKLKEEKVVDVFHVVRNLRRNRDVMIESGEQYLFCYEVLNAYLEENQTYANFR